MNTVYSDLSRALVARMFEGADFTCLDQSFQLILQCSSGDFLAEFRFVYINLFRTITSIWPTTFLKESSLVMNASAPFINPVAN